MRHELSRVRHVVTELSAILIGVLLVYLLVACILQVISRHTPMTGVGVFEESARYVLVSMTFLGLAATAGRTADVRIDILENLSLPPTAQRIISALALVVTIVFLIGFAWGAVVWLGELSRARQLSPSMRMPMHWLPIPIIVGSGLAVVNVILVRLSPPEELAQDHLEGVTI